MWRYSLVLCFAMLLASLFPVSTGFAQDESTPTKLTLYPADEPTPALKYRLLPPFLETIPGNAAVYYGKVKSERSHYFTNEEHWKKMDRWREMPLKLLNVSEYGVYFDLGFNEPLARGSRCRFCDWQLPIGDVPYYEMLLPQVHETIPFASILATDARLQLARGHYDQAILDLQRGYALGRHVAAGETLVNGLVAIRICRMMSDQLREYVQLQDTPNLYWALTDLPRPLIDMRRAYEVESQGISTNFPEIPDISNAKLSSQEWREMLSHIAQMTTLWISSGRLKYTPPTQEELDERCDQIRALAEDALVDSGIQRRRVEAMLRYQLAVVFTVLQDRRLLEEAAKYVSLPYPVAIAGIDVAIERASQEPHIVPIAMHTVPIFKTTRTAIAQNDREIAVLRVIEALRIYGAHHNGRLPQRLKDIKEVPVPDDPVTAEPFNYHLDGKTATLRGPTILDTPLNYEIEMVSAEE